MAPTEVFALRCRYIGTHYKIKTIQKRTVYTSHATMTYHPACQRLLLIRFVVIFIITNCYMDKAIGLKNKSGREGRDDVSTKKQFCINPDFAFKDRKETDPFKSSI